VTRRPAVVVIVACVAAVVAVGCGSNRRLSSNAASVLRPDVDAVHQAAVAGDRARTELELAALRHDVEQLRAQRRLTNGETTRILDAANVVQLQAAALPAPTTTTTATTTATTEPPTFAPASPRHHKRHEVDNGN
jgi:hypothetical protein